MLSAEEIFLAALENLQVPIAASITLIISYIFVATPKRQLTQPTRSNGAIFNQTRAASNG